MRSTEGHRLRSGKKQRLHGQDGKEGRLTQCRVLVSKALWTQSNCRSLWWACEMGAPLVGTVASSQLSLDEVRMCEGVATQRSAISRIEGGMRGDMGQHSIRAQA